MRVSVLQQFLHSLVGPLRAGASAMPVAGQLEQACQGLELFRDREVSEFSDFLRRAHNYEREGHWPVTQLAIAGELIDEPTPVENAKRLRSYLARHAPSGTPLSDAVKAELKKLEKKLTPATAREVAVHLGVTQPAPTTAKIVAQIVQHLTGQSLTSKGGAPSAKAGIDAAELRAHAQNLRQLAGTPAATATVNELKNDKKMTPAALKILAGELGVPTASRATKTTILRSIAEFLATKAGTLFDGPQETPPRRGDQVGRCAEIVVALKTKAESPGAPNEEIEAELRSLESQLNREEAIGVVKQLGIVRPVQTRQEAFEAIRRKVFEKKRAQESIAY